MEFEIYEDAKKEWRWTLKAANGEPIAVSSEGYKRREKCEDAIELLRNSASRAAVVTNVRPKRD